MRNTQLLTTGEAMAQTGLSRKALRLYERTEIVVPARNEAGYRLYDADAMRRLHLISRARGLNVHITELAEFLDIAEGCGDRNHTELIALVTAKLRETDQRVHELQELRQTLQTTLQRLELDAATSGHDQVHGVDHSRAPEARLTLVQMDSK